MTSQREWWLFLSAIFITKVEQKRYFPIAAHYDHQAILQSCHNVNLILRSLYFTALLATNAAQTTGPSTGYKQIKLRAARVQSYVRCTCTRGSLFLCFGLETFHYSHQVHAPKGSLLPVPNRLLRLHSPLFIFSLSDYFQHHKYSCWSILKTRSVQKRLHGRRECS